MTIDYARMKKTQPKLKAALTRAIKSKDRQKVIAACTAAVTEWDEIGAWPDDWSNWQRALNDVDPWNLRVELRDLRYQADF
jgi:hypothetical protein